MQTLRERLVAVLAHSVPCMTIQEFSQHPVIHENEDEVQQELNSLVQNHLFECGVTMYPPKYGQMLYYMADNNIAGGVFNAARARG